MLTSYNNGLATVGYRSTVPALKTSKFEGALEEPPRILRDLEGIFASHFTKLDETREALDWFTHASKMKIELPKQQGKPATVVVDFNNPSTGLDATKHFNGIYGLKKSIEKNVLHYCETLKMDRVGKNTPLESLNIQLDRYFHDGELLHAGIKLDYDVEGKTYSYESSTLDISGTFHAPFENLLKRFRAKPSPSFPARLARRWLNAWHPNVLEAEKIVDYTKSGIKYDKNHPSVKAAEKIIRQSRQKLLPRIHDRWKSFWQEKSIARSAQTSPKQFFAKTAWFTNAVGDKNNYLYRVDSEPNGNGSASGELILRCIANDKKSSKNIHFDCELATVGEENKEFYQQTLTLTEQMQGSGNPGIKNRKKIILTYTQQNKNPQSAFVTHMTTVEKFSVTFADGEEKTYSFTCKNTDKRIKNFKSFFYNIVNNHGNPVKSDTD